MKIVFLDEYSVCGCDLASVKGLGGYVGYYNTLPSQVVERCADADVVITNKVVISAEAMAQLPALKLICVAATGMNNVDLNAAAERGIEVRNAVGYSTHSVAETTLCSALALLREVVYYDEFFKSGRYSASPTMFNFDRPTHQLYGRHWGVVGMGNIGREVARLAAAFGCEVNYFSTSGITRKEGYEAVSLDELLAWADVVSIHSPLNDTTRNLIDEPQLAHMKRSALLINVARGGIVSESALARALDSGVIAGAAFDVFTQEPIAESNPLVHLKDKYRLLASPHNAWSAVESIDNLIAAIAANIAAFARQ